MKYLIHAYPKRMWYVEQYLIPSMLKQGIKKEDILLYNDDKGEGNLRSFLNSCIQLPDNEESTWHLQDDVCICKDFKERTELYNTGLVAGFSSELYDGPNKVGPVTVKDMWFSFPCILIPNKYAREASKWIDECIIGNPVYKQLWEKGKNDDALFRMYLKNCHKNDPVLNLAPNLVDHVDYLLGGGSGGMRKQECRAQYFKDLDVVKELETNITNHCKKDQFVL